MRSPVAVLATTMFLAVLITTAAPAEQPQFVTVRPQETDAILANPGMGWQSFYRTAREDRSLPAWIPSTIHYFRWGWADLEPEPGRIDHNVLDNTLRRTHAAGQKLAFRVMNASPETDAYVPPWLTQVGGRELICAKRYPPGWKANEPGRGETSGSRVPDLDHPTVLQYHLDFIRLLGERYDGHAAIDHIDIGSVGWWGEWHMSGSNCSMPTLATRRKIIDTYLASFQKTRLLMNILDPEMLQYAVARGTGWRADCLGDMQGWSQSGFSRWNHTRNGYPAGLTQARALDAWKVSPVAWEPCRGIGWWVEEGWPLRYIFNYALALHGSHFQNLAKPLPEGADVRPEIERFLRRLGYRLVLRDLNHPAEGRAGQQVPVAMLWQNTGSAPCYAPYRLAYRLSSREGRAWLFVSRVTVNQWLPGSVELFTEAFFRMPPDLPPGEIVRVNDAIQLPHDLPPGEYTLSLAVVGEDSEPVVRLGIQGRAADGWYPLSTLRVVQ